MLFFLRSLPSFSTINKSKLEDSQRVLGNLNSFDPRILGLKTDLFIFVLFGLCEDSNLSAQNLFKDIGTLSSLVHGRGLRFSRN